MSKPQENWAVVGGEPGGNRFSALTQINTRTVKNLKVAWTFSTKDASPGSTIECTPIVVDGVLYATTVKVDVIALNAATGKLLWRYPAQGGGVNRGVVYWTDGKEKRIIAALSNGTMIALDAATGKRIPTFGMDGVLNLREGLERNIDTYSYGCSSPPALYKDTLICGFLSAEGQPGAPGDIRAFDVRTGKELWRFHTVPRPGEFGNETWEPESWKERAGANPWSGFTLDAKRGIVFCGVGSAASDFYGGDRKGANLFANCTLALDARTGKRLWHFQNVHHDVWDHDTPCPPVLCTVKRNGKTIDAVAQPTKTGFVYVFERVSGKPLFPIREVAAPVSDIPGEQTHPTQPEPVLPPPLTPQVFTNADITTISPEAARSVQEQLQKLRYGKRFLPPTLEGTVVTPGFHGGANWSGAAFDPTTGMFYLNTCNVPVVYALKKNNRGGYDFGGYKRFTDHEGFPAIKPPWGTLHAIQLSTGRISWQKTLGTEPKLAARGLPPTGSETFGGCIVTAGGLVFIAGSKDETFRAFDKRTGTILWEHKLPHGGYATPCTYSVNGKQYVVIAAGGGGKLGTPSGDTYLAFALE